MLVNALDRPRSRFEIQLGIWKVAEASQRQLGD
jgi:hypothetical protein